MHRQNDNGDLERLQLLSKQPTEDAALIAPSLVFFSNEFNGNGNGNGNGNNHMHKHKHNNGTTKDRPPSSKDVVCARGRAYWDHPGNRAYRELIGSAKTKYSMAKNRVEKSTIVSEIIEAVGRFVKKSAAAGWIECEENFVREKVTQSLRDGLSFKYSSSTVRKRERKAKSQNAFRGDIDRVVRSNHAVSRKIRALEQRVEQTNTEARRRGISEAVSDEALMRILDQGNLDILETMKKDRSLLKQLRLVTNATNIVSASVAATPPPSPPLPPTMTPMPLPPIMTPITNNANNATTTTLHRIVSLSSTSTASLPARLTAEDRAAAVAAMTVPYDFYGDCLTNDDDVALDLDSSHMLIHPR